MEFPLRRPMPMLFCLLLAFVAESVSGCLAAEPGWLLWPSPTNAVQFCLATNAAAGAAARFNTFAIRAWGQTLLSWPGPGVERFAGNDDAPLAGADHVLINGAGPVLNPNVAAPVLETASGRDWSYVALDLTPAYRDRLRLFRRSILYVEPDLFVLHDQVEADAPVRYQMILHPPVATVLDPDWGDLRLATDQGGLWIHAPSSRRELRRWERLVPGAEVKESGVLTMGLGPTNSVTHLNVLVAFALTPPGGRPDFAFKLLESPNAIGARIHRHGLPTLVAFRTSPGSAGASLTGFAFQGPVGVDAFRPRRRAVSSGTPGAASPAP